MSAYSDLVHARALETLANTEPTPEELAEQAERARRNKIDRIMAQPALTDASGASPGHHVPATTETRASGLPGSEYATKKWTVSQLDTLAQATGASLGKFGAKHIKPLLAELEQARSANEAIGRVADRLSTELAALRREFDLEKKLEAQRNKRRVESLEIALIAAGRNPAEVDVETEIPKMEWNGHAQ